MALSTDSGTSWITYNINTAKFETINISDIAAFLANGLNTTVLTTIDYTALNTMIAQNRKLRFAYILEKPTLNDICKLRKIKIFYN